MSRLTSRINPHIYRVARAIRGRTQPNAALGSPSPYAQWHGPDAAAARTPILVCTSVADIVLLQGCAPTGAELAIELDSEQTTHPVTHRFPHPDTPLGPRRCFEMTFDRSSAGSATRARLVADGTAGGWVAIPELPKPGAMTGAEHIERCPACTRSDFAAAGRRQHLVMVTCQTCGLMMTNPRPIEDHTLVRYSERYFDEEYLPSQQLTPALTTHIDSILDHVEPVKRPGASLFELGVGGGNLLARAAERGWLVSGTDVNPASIAHGESRGLNVWLENADHADTLQGPYDAVISEMSLEHVRRPEHFCALAAADLAPGGRLVIYTVSAEGESFEQSGMASPLVGPAEHLFLFSAGSLVAMCEAVGLRVDTVWRNHTGDEIGIVASKRRDIANPGVPRR